MSQFTLLAIGLDEITCCETLPQCYLDQTTCVKHLIHSRLIKHMFYKFN
jgi:hypothetical protein